MSERATLLNSISEEEQWQVTAYLIAISPQLQRAKQQASKQKQEAAQCLECLKAMQPDLGAPFDRVRAQQLVQKKCTECHGLENIENSPPDSMAGSKALVARMVGEGFTANDDEIKLIVRYLTEKYATRKPKQNPVQP